MWYDPQQHAHARREGSHDVIVDVLPTNEDPSGARIYFIKRSLPRMRTVFYEAPSEIALG